MMANTIDKDIYKSSDTIIVGAGPIGLELAAVLKRQGFDYLHLEAQQIGCTMTWWPRETYFFSTTERIEIAGIPASTTDQQRLTGEQYLAYLRSVVEQLDLQVQTYERVVEINPINQGFLIRTITTTGERLYFSNRVVIATGDMHAPNLLDIPGEDLPHVSHYFQDPHKYFRKRLLIVGGRNSAVEAALRCWRAGSQVTISYRRSSFNPELIKHWLLPDLETQIEHGAISFLPCTQPVKITPAEVIFEKLDPEMKSTGELLAHPADFVLLNTGFRADMSLFQTAGVKLSGPEQTPQYNPKTMETNIPGLYVAGTAAAGTQKRYTLFIENCHIHVARIVAALTGRWPDKIGTIPERQYELPLEAFQDN